MFLPYPRVKLSIVGSLRDREVVCSVSDRQGSNFESCVWRTMSSHSSHHPQEVHLAQSSLYVHKGGLKTDSFYHKQYLSVSQCLESAWVPHFSCVMYMMYSTYIVGVYYIICVSSPVRMSYKICLRCTAVSISRCCVQAIHTFDRAYYYSITYGTYN